jgi:hypothetical protein
MTVIDDFSTIPATIVEYRKLTKSCTVLFRFSVVCHNALFYHSSMKQSLQILFFGCVAVFGASCAEAWATTLLQCRQGASKHEYINVRYLVRASDQRQLQQQLADWARARNYAAYGQRGEDGLPSRSETWTSILESHRGGVRIEVHFTDGSQNVMVRVKNQCWNAPEDWRQHWRDFQLQMSSWSVYRAK